MACYRYRVPGIFVPLVLVCYFGLTAQTDTAFQLLEVEVTALRIDFSSTGKHTEPIDSQSLAQGRYDNLAALLSRQTPLYVRSYGLGTLATLGIRGGSANHTQVMWNGIPLRNPMVGLTDLALIPSGMIDRAAIHYGGHGAAFGSGAIGGLIAINNEMVSKDNGIDLHLSYGSWSRRLGEAKLDYGLGRLRLSTRLMLVDAENDFLYKLNRDLPERRQVHHHLENRGILQEAAWYVNDSEHLTARFWYQDADRQIPPTSVQNRSEAGQQDKNLRASLHWSRIGDKWSWQAKTAWLDEEIQYQDSAILLYTVNGFRTWLAEAESAVRLTPSIRMAGGIFVESSEASSPNYDTDHIRRQQAAFGTVRLVRNDWIARLQMREEITDGNWSPLLIDVSSEWMTTRDVTVKASLSRNYRVPSLNDLYWRPGGNINLIPEQGWTLEGGVEYQRQGDNSGAKLALTAYRRILDQWIMWMPPTKGVNLYWTPINAARVNTTGLELRYGLHGQKKQWRVSLDGGMDLTHSVFGRPIPEFHIDAGKQVFYIPLVAVQSTLKIARSGWMIWYSHNWFGISPGINEDVGAGNIGAGGASTAFKFGHLAGSLYIQAENIWNVPYRLMERRPMPGRTLTGGLKLTI